MPVTPPFQRAPEIERGAALVRRRASRAVQSDLLAVATTPGKQSLALFWPPRCLGPKEAQAGRTRSCSCSCSSLFPSVGQLCFGLDAVLLLQSRSGLDSRDRPARIASLNSLDWRTKQSIGLIARAAIGLASTSTSAALFISTGSSQELFGCQLTMKARAEHSLSYITGAINASQAGTGARIGQSGGKQEFCPITATDQLRAAQLNVKLN